MPWNEHSNPNEDRHMSEFTKNPDEIGALWLRSGAKGDYMTGTINGEKVVLFHNAKKTSEKQPDWRVLKSKPRDAAQASTAPIDLTPGVDDVPF